MTLNLNLGAKRLHCVPKINGGYAQLKVLLTSLNNQWVFKNLGGFGILKNIIEKRSKKCRYLILKHIKIILENFKKKV